MNLILIRMCVLAILSVGVIYCFQVIPERAYLRYTNPQYVENFTIQVRRYNRKSLYYVNIQGIIKHTWNNNVSIHIELYEYVHSEYRRSYVEIRGPLCSTIQQNPVVQAVVKSAGVVCPLPSGLVVLRNLTLIMDNFPFNIRFDKGFLNISTELTKTREEVATAQIYVTLKQSKKN